MALVLTLLNMLFFVTNAGHGHTLFQRGFSTRGSLQLHHEMLGDMRQHLCWSWHPVSLAWSQDVAEQDRRYAPSGSTQAGNLKK